MQSIQSIVDEIEADIIAITETKLNTVRNINIPGYKWIGRPRLNKEGEGVGVFVKQEITQSMTIHKIGEDNLEIIWIRMCLRKKKELYIGVYYGKQETRTLKEELINEVIDIASQIKKIQEKSDNILLVGDFNAKLFDGRSRNGRIMDKELIKPLNLTILNRNEECIGKWTRKNTSNDTERSEIDYAITTENMWHSVRKMVIDEKEEFKLKGKKPSDHNTMIIKLELQADQK